MLLSFSFWSFYTHNRLVLVAFADKHQGSFTTQVHFFDPGLSNSNPNKWCKPRHLLSLLRPICDWFSFWYGGPGSWNLLASSYSSFACMTCNDYLFVLLSCFIPSSIVHRPSSCFVSFVRSSAISLFFLSSYLQRQLSGHFEQLSGIWLIRRNTSLGVGYI